MCCNQAPGRTSQVFYINRGYTLCKVDETEFLDIAAHRVIPDLADCENIPPIGVLSFRLPGGKSTRREADDRVRQYRADSSTLIHNGRCTHQMKVYQWRSTIKSVSFELYP